MDSVGTDSDATSEERSGDNVSRDDRRTTDRIVCARPHPVRIMVRPSLFSYQAHLHNFTNMGLGLAVGQPFEPGTVLAVQLRIAKSGLSCVLSATVVRCQQEAAGAWFLGCKLSRPLNDEETRGLF